MRRMHRHMRPHPRTTPTRRNPTTNKQSSQTKTNRMHRNRRITILKNQNHNTTTQTSEVSKLITKGGAKFLSTLKTKSIRSNNSYYRILTIEKRRFIDAVIQTVNKIQSPLLVKALTPIAEKLLQAIGGIQKLVGHLTYEMQTYGAPLAQKISQLANGWGNKAASKWATDQEFIRYLAVLEINNLPIYRVTNKP